jgi:hypothetical protein
MPTIIVQGALFVGKRLATGALLAAGFAVGEKVIEKTNEAIKNYKAKKAPQAA